MTTTVQRIVAGVVVALLVVAGLTLALVRDEQGYRITLVAPSAAQVLEDVPVWIEGQTVGRVESIETRDGKALITVSVDDAMAPLHAGTSARLEWNTVLGERVVTLYPGPTQAPMLASGAMLEAGVAQVEVDTVLAALDKPTRDRLTSLIGQLDGTLSGREPAVRDTLRSAGPTVAALSSVLEGVGRDGRAIASLVTELRGITGPLAERQDLLRGSITDLSRFTSVMAPVQAQLRDGLRDLPETLKTARDTLDLVPPAAEATVPLLKDLESPTKRLPSVAGNLSPLLRDLRPTVKELRPTLRALSGLLGKTPRLLDVSNATLPPLTQTVSTYQPAVSFLRPYVPEAVGFLGNWGNAFSGFDGAGHVWAGIPAIGGTSVDEIPQAGAPALASLPNGFKVVDRPPPGNLVGQPFTDANGEEVR